MATSRSSTSSSRPFIRDVLVALLVLVIGEVFLARSLALFEPDGEAVPVAATERFDGFHVVSPEDPLTFFAELGRRSGAGPVVFVGDSQGAAALGGGSPYPMQGLEALQATDTDATVISLHMGGANAYEQASLLLAMLEAGVRPRLVVWSHSIFSQRKNQIRSELVPTYHSVAETLDRLAGNVTLAGNVGAEPVETDSARRLVTNVTRRWDGVIAGTAGASFMRRSLWDKGQILRRSELGRLIPTSLLGGTARQFDPPASILRDAAGVVGGVSRILVDRGICVVNFVAPIDRDVSPRPFALRAEAVSYPALEAASQAAGAVFVNLLDAMPHAHFGTYEDGTPDAFHFDTAGHGLLVEELLQTATAGCADLTR